MVAAAALAWAAGYIVIAFNLCLTVGYATIATVHTAFLAYTIVIVVWSAVVIPVYTNLLTVVLATIVAVVVTTVYVTVAIVVADAIIVAAIAYTVVMTYVRTQHLRTTLVDIGTGTAVDY